MHRKDFLRKASLAAIVAAGTRKVFANNPSAKYGNYLSEKILTKADDKLYLQYELKDMNYSFLLEPDAFSYFNMYVTLNFFGSLTQVKPEFEDSVIYKKDSKSVLKDGSYNINVTMSEDQKYKYGKHELLKKMTVKMTADQSKVSLQTGKKSWVDLALVKQSDEREGCFLTSACTASRGLADNCDELQSLRQFRDSILKPTGIGTQLVEAYYQIAPAIVQQIDGQSNAGEIWDHLYTELVLESKQLIESGRHTAAINHYSNYVLWLKEMFL